MNTPVDPIIFFRELYHQFQEHDIPEPSAMSLATATRDGKPSVRTVLLKNFDEKGFVFYTNLESRKGKELKGNPHAALCFYWEAIHYQVRVEGKVERVSDEEADAYFASRPRGSQLGAWASRQSSILRSRDELDESLAKQSSRFENRNVPRPEFWSGFRLVPATIGFWNRQDNRLHERILYTKTGSGWTMNLLYP